VGKEGVLGVTEQVSFSYEFVPNDIRCIQVQATQGLQIQRLGAYTKTPGVKIYVALYDDQGDFPQDLLAQTDVLLSVDGRTFGAVPPVFITPGFYHLCIIAEGIFYAYTAPYENPGVVSVLDDGTVPFAEFSSRMPQLVRAHNLLPDLFAVGTH
jgi:hypothetical protein